MSKLLLEEFTLLTKKRPGVTMKLFEVNHRNGLLLALFIGSLISTHSDISYSNQDVAYYSDLQDFANEAQVIGTVVQIGSNWCWSSRRPTGSQAQKRLQIFVRDKWRNVGKVIFRKTEACGKKYPYEQIFEWEIDRLGSLDREMPYFGTLRLRETTSSPSAYAKVSIYESSQAIQEVRSLREALGRQMLECLILGGQWDQDKDICVKP